MSKKFWKVKTELSGSLTSEVQSRTQAVLVFTEFIELVKKINNKALETSKKVFKIKTRIMEKPDDNKH